MRVFFVATLLIDHNAYFISPYFFEKSRPYGEPFPFLIMNSWYQWLFYDIWNCISDVINSILDITNSINDIMNSIHDIINTISDICKWS